MAGAIYLDTSAAAKLVVDELESEALARHLDEHARAGGGICASLLLETELRRLAVRLDLPQSVISDVLESIDLYELPPSLFYESGIMAGPSLRSLDALHLAAAIRLEVAAVVTYDGRMASNAEGLGLRVVAPGR